MSGDKQYEKTFSRRNKADKPTNNVLKREKEKGKRKEREVDQEVVLKDEEENGKDKEVPMVPSSSVESQGERDASDGEDARKPIENGDGRSVSVSSSPKQKRKSDPGGGGGGGNVGRKEQPKQKKQKQEKELQLEKQKKEGEEKAEPKQKQEGKKQKGKDGGERESVKKKVEEKGKKQKGKDGGERETVKKVEEKGKKNKKKEEEKKREGEGSAGCRFPMNRVSRIIRSEGSDYRITHEAVFLINKATEKFLEVFCEDSYKSMTEDCKNYVSYKHLSTVVSKEKRLDFLSDYVPEKVKAETALAERKPVEK